jgi:hypothetical protein
MSFDPSQLELTDSQKQQVKRWLDSKGVKTQCQVCSSGEYLMLGHALGLILGHINGAVELTLNMGVVPVRCNNCAHVMLFSTHPMNIT